MLSQLLIGLLILILIFIITSLPLYFATKMLRGRTTLLRAIATNVLAGLAVIFCHLIFPVIGGIIGFIAILILYRFSFRVGFIRAIIIWLIEVILVGLFTLLGILLGIGALHSVILL